MIAVQIVTPNSIPTPTWSTSIQLASSRNAILTAEIETVNLSFYVLYPTDNQQKANTCSHQNPKCRRTGKIYFHYLVKLIPQHSGNGLTSCFSSDCETLEWSIHWLNQYKSKVGYSEQS